MSPDGVYGVGVSGEKPPTTFQDCVSTFVSLKPLDILKSTSGQFAVTKIAILSQDMIVS